MRPSRSSKSSLMMPPLAATAKRKSTCHSSMMRALRPPYLPPPKETHSTAAEGRPPQDLRLPSKSKRAVYVITSKQPCHREALPRRRALLVVPVATFQEAAWMPSETSAAGVRTFPAVPKTNHAASVKSDARLAAFARKTTANPTGTPPWTRMPSPQRIPASPACRP